MTWAVVIDITKVLCICVQVSGFHDVFIHRTVFEFYFALKVPKNSEVQTRIRTYCLDSFLLQVVDHFSICSIGNESCPYIELNEVQLIPEDAGTA